MLPEVFEDFEEEGKTETIPKFFICWAMSCKI